ncbi:ABC transporter permease [Paenarthrobacter sp. NPDC089322]|uniref:ABC transporter permease n=1 Tax=Paenarthrobacter sp. NPDC089322 TaxID=3155065 RepID=UPI00341B624D
MTILVAVLVLLCAVLALTSNRFLSTGNVVAIFQAMAVLCIASIGQTLAIITGGFDLSIGGVLPLAGIVFATTVNTVPGPVGVVVAIFAALAIGAAVGLVNGFFITKLKVNPLITTLGTLSVAGGAAFLFNNGVTTIVSSPAAKGLTGPVFGRLTWDVVMFIGLALLTTLILHYTIWGRIMYALGGSREAVRRAGIRADRATTSIYIASGCFAAFAGVIAASQLQAASPTSYSNAPLSTITAVILGGAALYGGRGTILGTVLGSLLLGVIANGLNLLQINTFYQTIITGAVLLLAVGLTKIRDSFSRNNES